MLKKFKTSAQNLTTTRGLVMTAMFIAMHAVLGIFKFQFVLENRITLTFAVTAAAGALLGPVPAMVVGALGDILGYFLNPGGGMYFFGFTVSAMLGGLVYGICLYKRSSKRAVWWIILSVFLITLFVNIILNTYWLSVMYNKAYHIFAVERIIKNFVAFPLHVIIIFALFMLIDRTGVRKKYL